VTSELIIGLIGTVWAAMVEAEEKMEASVESHRRGGCGKCGKYSAPRHMALWDPWARTFSCSLSSRIQCSSNVRSSQNLFSEISASETAGAEDQTVAFFWALFDSLEESQKHGLLNLITGSE
jgi:hypothetical protein